MPDGHFLVTEINGDWVDEIDASGHVYWSANPPGVNYPSDSNQVGPNRYLTVDYSYPGQIVVFNRAGQSLWRYAPTTGAPAELDHPSLAMALPNGDVLLNDDYDDRVIVVDPGTDQIVWQYGHDGVAGARPGTWTTPMGSTCCPRSLMLTATSRRRPPRPRARSSVAEWRWPVATTSVPGRRLNLFRWSPQADCRSSKTRSEPYGARPGPLFSKKAIQTMT